MNRIVQSKNLIILLMLALLLIAPGCKETDVSTSGNAITCYTAAYSSGIYQSDNGGVSWYPLAADQEDLSLFSKRLFLSPDNKRLYITTTGAGLFYFDIGEDALNSVDEFKDDDIRSLAFRNISNAQGTQVELFVARKESGIYRSIQGTDKWETFNNGLTYHDVNVLYSNVGNLFAGTVKALFRWDETAKRWLDISQGIKNKNIMSICADPQGKTIYAGTGVYQDNKGRFERIPCLYKSADNGRTWEKADKGLPSGTLVFSIAVNPVKPERIYLGTSDGIYRSIDGGNKWTRMEGGVPKKFQAFDIKIAQQSDGKALVYAAGANGLYMATDEENPKWKSRDYGLDETYISSVATAGNGRL